MIRLKWLQLTPVVPALVFLSAAASAADPPAQVAQTTPAPPETAQATPPPATAPEPAPPAEAPAPTNQVFAPPPPPPPPPAPPPPADNLPPGSFKIPGTKTTLTLSGYAQLDVMYDIRGRNPNVEGVDFAAQAAVVPINNGYESKQKQNQLYLTARTSRLGVSTNTETSLANIGVKIEGDFNAGNLLGSQTFTNSVLFRLRHAYGTLSGQYGTLLVGQSWSTFLDLPSYAETVDFNGSGDISLIRQPQARYTFPLPKRFVVALAAENSPGTDQNGITDAGRPTQRLQSIPDLIAVVGASGGWGSASVGAVTLQYKNAALPNTPTGPGSESYAKQGWGLRAALALKLPWGDTFRGYVAGGNGIGRYILNVGAAGQGASVNPAGDDFILWKAMAYHVNYTHVWSPMFRSNVTFSQTFLANNHTVIYTGDTANVNNLNSRIEQLFVNTYFTLSKQVEFGLEYMFNNRHTFGPDSDPSGTTGTQHRVSTSAHFNFF